MLDSEINTITATVQPNQKNHTKIILTFAVPFIPKLRFHRTTGSVWVSDFATTAEPMQLARTPNRELVMYTGGHDIDSATFSTLVTIISGNISRMSNSMDSKSWYNFSPMGPIMMSRLAMVEKKKIKLKISCF